MLIEPGAWAAPATYSPSFATIRRRPSGVKRTASGWNPTSTTRRTAPVCTSKNATFPSTVVLSFGMMLATPNPRPSGSAATLLTERVALAPKIGSKSATTSRARTPVAASE